jgi:hypothetical protein
MPGLAQHIQHSMKVNGDLLEVGVISGGGKVADIYNGKEREIGEEIA